jgi:hypothetical protein
MKAKNVGRSPDCVEIGIAAENAGGVGENQRVDACVRPGTPQTADQRRGQQNVAQPAQRDNQNARLGGKLDPRHGGGASRCLSAMPPATPTPIT